ncbi:MAG: hypothetical protein PHR53_08480 [Bacteroidales bacterium]|nr:hypothetical protein [Bacteroidales bacterium]
MESQHTLLIFNPEHDLALANGDAHFNAPISAIELAQDAAWLPAWMTKEGYVWNASPFSEDEKSVFQQLGFNAIAIVDEELPNIKWQSVVPWGWDAALKRKLQKVAINESILPDDQQLQFIRDYSHRRFAIETLQYLLENSTFSQRFPKLPQFFTKLSEIEIFLQKNQSVVLKAPWSGSGKGLRWCQTKLSKSDEGWCRHTIEKQGGVIGEQRQKVVQDFAMEFFCDTEVSFVGYSLFQTENGMYQGNMLASDSTIEQKLQKWMNINELQEIKQLLIHFFSQHLLSKYHGYLGVDMFIYQENQSFKIHPVVEINLRMTMGLLARQFYNRFISFNSIGRLQMHYSPVQGKLLTKHLQNQSLFPLQIESNRIVKGYLSLCPIFEGTKYGFSIFINQNLII